MRCQLYSRPAGVRDDASYEPQYVAPCSNEFGYANFEVEEVRP
jgi:hypothetical protein